MITHISPTALYPVEGLSLQDAKTMRAEWTGEKRPPRIGEWFLSGAYIAAYKAGADLATPYHIARLVQVKMRTIIVRQSEG